MLCDRFGFRGEQARTAVRDLSGGERRRLQLMRLLIAEPNVLLLDEPTNDLDIDTLTALEDLLDGWPGTLVVVSHDRYFVERVCDDVYALTGDGGIRHLPGGIEQYVELRRDGRGARARGRGRRARPPAGAVVRAARKEITRLERALERLGERETELQVRWRRAPPTTCACASCRRSSQAAGAEREQLETAAWLARRRVARGAGPSGRRCELSERARSRRSASSARTSASPARSSGSPTSTGRIESCSSHSTASASSIASSACLEEPAHAVRRPARRSRARTSGRAGRGARRTRRGCAWRGRRRPGRAGTAPPRAGRRSGRRAARRRRRAPRAPRRSRRWPARSSSSSSCRASPVTYATAGLPRAAVAEAVDDPHLTRAGRVGSPSERKSRVAPA